MSTSLDRVAGPLARAVGVGGLLTIPVTVALYQVVRATDEGLALTALLLGVAGALGGWPMGRGTWRRSSTSPRWAGDNASPDPGGVLRYATAGLALMLIGWLVVAARRGPLRCASARSPSAAVWC